MSLNLIMGISTFIVTLLLGFVSKKNEDFKNELIPLQNLGIGLLGTFIYYLFTKDWNVALSGVGLFAGGLYDIRHNFQKLYEKATMQKETEENNDDIDY